MPLALLILAVGAAILGCSVYRWAVSRSRSPATEVRLVQKYPHDPNSFCQGLVVHGETLLEGTGLYRKIQPQTRRAGNWQGRSECPAGC